MVSSNTFGTVTLRSDTGEEFRVNGQRLKHYLSREEGMEELQQDFESEKYSRKEGSRGIVFVLWPNSLEQLSS